MKRRSRSSARWLKEHFADPFVQRAQSEGWRSRAVFKLEEIDRRLKLLKPGGFLVTCSCSYHVPEALFLQILAEAAIDARRSIVVVDRRTQAQDHPILLTMPETHYLKCIIVKALQ